jgi:predicted dithiol-disulfide oxidoreductase (DUF899 family)
MQHAVVSQNEWLAARKALLAKEKEFTRARDQLSEARRALPWVNVEKNYVFEGPNGRETLSDLFGGKSQLIIYHFMLGPGWVQGCPSCSFLADHFDGAAIHLAQRDVSLVVVSRAPFAEIEAYKKRMGWKFKWVSSYGNYAMTEFPSEEAPGLSTFIKTDNGQVLHTYSSYARGLDILVGAYNFLDFAPKGRDEGALPWSMAWVRRHDEYETAPPPKAGCCG